MILLKSQSKLRPNLQLKSRIGLKVKKFHDSGTRLVKYIWTGHFSSADKPKATIIFYLTIFDFEVRFLFSICDIEILLSLLTNIYQICIIWFCVRTKCILIHRIFFKLEVGSKQTILFLWPLKMYVLLSK